MDKILILGAGIYQVPLIKKAKEMGYFTIVTSIKGDYPGFEYADHIYFEDTTDKDKVLSIAQKEQVRAILTTGTDVAVNTIGYVCDKLGLPGISAESALCVTDKALMKEAFSTCDVSMAKFCRVSDIEMAYAASEKLNYPVMFKCVDKSGSRGIIKVCKKEEVETAYKYVIDSTQASYFIVEEFIDGVELGVDGYVGEEDLFIIPHDKIVFGNGSTNVPIGHVFPSCCNSHLLSIINSEVYKAIKALKLKKVFFNADIIISNDKCYILELGGRCGATCIPELVSLHFGIDYYKKMIENALGRNILFPETAKKAYIGELLLSKKNGVLKDIIINKDKMSGVKQLQFDYKIGDYIRAFRVGPDRIGHIIVEGDNTDIAKKNLENAKRNIQLIVE